MKPNEFRKVQVNITTYKKDRFKEHMKDMNEDKNRGICKAKLNNKFVCSICLNSKPEDKTNESYRRNFKSCPICQRSCDICMEKIHNKTEKSQFETQKLQNTNMEIKEAKKTETKSIQTVQTDLNKSLNLLNEVLTVFQSKKVEQVKSKTVILKDASVSTNDVRTQSKLSVSKVFQFSLDKSNANEDGKFIVMSSKMDSNRSNIDLIINKSSSVPQMKLEELKYNLKEKTKSKDAIEEVNRMFATVRRNHKNDNLNRPSIRSGPRILPVVETMADHNEKFLKDNETNFIRNRTCKYCQTNCMSSGDSIDCCHVKDNERCDKSQCRHIKENERCDKSQCCHIKEDERCDKSQCCHIKEDERCEKCVYMLCCHYKNYRQMQASVMICERCRDKKTWGHSEHSFKDSG